MRWKKIFAYSGVRREKLQKMKKDRTVENMWVCWVVVTEEQQQQQQKEQIFLEQGVFCQRLPSREAPC